MGGDPQQSRSSFTTNIGPGIMETVLFKTGKAIGTYPIQTYAVAWLLLIGVGVGGWLSIEGPHPNNSITSMNFKLLWSNSESDIAREVALFLDLHGQDSTKDFTARSKPFYKPGHYSMFVARGDKRGEDIMNKEVHDEIWWLYKAFFDIEVTTKNGYTYGTRDICDRGGFPDSEGGLITPCMTSDTFQCFGEYFEILHPTYQEIDPDIDNATKYPALAPNYPLPFSSRPKWRESTPEQMRAEVSKQQITGERGCSGWIQLATWTTKYWGGGLKWNAEKTLLTHIGGLAWVLFYDGYARAAFRMSKVDPDRALPKEIDEAVDLHKVKWNEYVWDFNGCTGVFAEGATEHGGKYAGKCAKLTEASNLRPGFVDEIEDKSEQIPWGLLISGVVLMHIFVFTSNYRLGDHVHSRASFGMNGLAVVGLSTIGGSGLILLMGFRFNASMIGALPLLSLGLGLDDMFVVMRYFLQIVQEQGQDAVGKTDVQKFLDTPMWQITGQVLEEAGPGVFLTSFVNSISFGMGALLPIPGLATFCIGACVASVLNLFCILTLFFPYMCLEVNRIKAMRREYCCSKVLEYHNDKDLTKMPPYQWGWEDHYTNWLKKTWAPLLVRNPAVRFGTIFIFLAYFAWMVRNIIELKSAGYTPKQIAPHGTIEYLGLEHLFDFFGIFPAWLVFYNVDIPNKQAEMLQFHDDITNTPYCQKHPIPPYITLFGLFNPGLLDNSTYTHPTLAPGGIVKTETPEEFYALFNAFRQFPPLDKPDDALLPERAFYAFADLVFCNEFTYHPTTGDTSRSVGPMWNPDDTTIEFSFFAFFITNLVTDQDFIEMIKTVKEVTNNKNPLGREHAFPYSDMLTFWSVFLDIEPIMWRALLINNCVLFILTFILLKSLFVAIVSTLTCMMIVVEIYGVMMMEVQYNVFVATGLIACSGIAIEDVAHFVASFRLTQGNTEHRIATAMGHTFVAIKLGSMSTFLALVPLAFHWMDFIILYQFMLFIILVIMGVVNGTLFLPAVLASIGVLTEKKQPSVAEGSGPDAPIGSGAAVDPNPTPGSDDKVKV